LLWAELLSGACSDAVTSALDRANTGKMLRMSNIASALKAEIARVARKEIKAETGALKGATARFRSDIAALKRQVADLQSQLKRASKAAPASGRSLRAEPAEPAHRFSAKGLASQRKRLGLSAEAMGKLIGVSGLSIYHWEGGKARPREKYLPAIAALKKLGRKNAAAILATR
jgi:DNA-binding transcriptional regulator YiaG